MKKKILTFILVTCVVLPLAACNGESTSEVGYAPASLPNNSQTNIESAPAVSQENSMSNQTPSKSVPSETDAPTSANAESLDSSSPDTERELDTIGGIDVAQNLLDVTITIPADFVGDATQEDLDQHADGEGYKSITLNEDGSATWVMTKTQHKEMMDEISESIDQSLAEMIGSEEYPSISSIEANDDFTDFTVTITGDSLDMSESLCVFSLSMQSGLYHLFNGTSDNVDNVHVSFVNADTGELIEDWNSSEA